MQKLLAVLLLVALEAWSSGEKQKHIFFLEKKKTQQKTQKTTEHKAIRIHGKTRKKKKPCIKVSQEFSLLDL